MHGYLLIFKRFPYIYLNLFSISTTAQRQKKETLNLFNTINVLCWITLLLLLFIFIDKMKLNFPFSVAALFIHINYLFDIQTVCFKLIFGYLKFMKILLVLILVEFFVFAHALPISKNKRKIWHFLGLTHCFSNFF